MLSFYIIEIALYVIEYNQYVKLMSSFQGNLSKENLDLIKIEIKYFPQLYDLPAFQISD